MLTVHVPVPGLAHGSPGAKVSTIFAFVLEVTQDGFYTLVLAKEFERTMCDITFRIIF
jgi:hypothetical protein